GRVVNRGRISGGGEHTGIHIVFDDAGDDTKVTVENKPGGVITGADGVAIRATDVTPDGDGGGTVWLVNEGTIRGDVNLQTGGNHTVISKGAHVLTPSLIDGNLFLGSGNDTVSIELGKVKGNMSLGAGDDKLTVAGSVVEGNVDLGAGGDRAEIKGSTVTGDLRLGSGKDQLTVDTKVRIFGAIDGGRSETGQLEEDLLVLLDGDGTGQLLGVQNFHTIDNSAGGDWEFGQLSVDQGQQVNVIGSLTAGLVWLAPDARLVIDHLVVDHVSIYGEVNQAGFLAG